MLLDINGNVLSSPIDQTPMRDNWDEYVIYTNNTDLCDFTKEELHRKINAIKRKGISVIDATILIGRFLRELGINDNFHQQFRAAFPTLDSRLVLAMQLFILLHEDDRKWTFIMPDDIGGLFINASYVVAKE